MLLPPCRCKLIASPSLKPVIMIAPQHFAVPTVLQVALFLELCMYADAVVSKAAATCVLDLVLVFPQQVAPWLLSPESSAFITTNILQGGSADGATPPPPVAVQQLVLETLVHAAREPNCVQPGSAEIGQLHEAVAQLASSMVDGQGRTLANQLTQLLKPFV